MRQPDDSVPPSRYAPHAPGDTHAILPGQLAAPCLAPDDVICTPPVPHFRARSSALALSASAILHLALWQLLAPAPPLLQTAASSPPPIAIHLQQPPPSAPEGDQAVVEAAPVLPQPQATTLPQQAAAKTAQTETAQTGQARALPRAPGASTAAKPHQSARTEANVKHMIQRYFAAPPIAPEESATQPNKDHGRVFSSELQQKIDRARATMRPEATQQHSVYTTGAGQEVFIKGDNCSKIDAATDDYDIELWQVAKRCAWLKTDSEQFMQRVNLELKTRNKEP